MTKLKWTAEELWQAIASRDKAFDGKFFYGVTSTGIFCRPSCPSKVPRRENVRIFASAAEAMAAGFRPCKRCRPDLLSYTPLEDLARDVKAALDGCFDKRAELMERLQDMGASEKHLAEIFQTTYGLTPKAYIAGLRLEKAKDCLLHGLSISETTFASGFTSESGFYSFFKQQTGLSPKAFIISQTHNQAILTYDSPIGTLQLAATAKGLTHIKMVASSEKEALVADKAAVEIATAAKAQLREYFDHTRRTFDVPLAPEGTAFQQQVWQALRHIPYGETRSYGAIAATIGKPKAARAVGMANNKNPLLIVVPCHLVIGKNGALVGYAAGLDVKQYLLDWESSI